MTDNTAEVENEAGHDAAQADGTATHTEGEATEAHSAESVDHGTELLGTDLHTETGQAETSAGMPQFDTTTYGHQAFWLAISLVMVYFILSRIALPRIGGVLEQRSQTIRRDLDRAADMRTKAQEAEEAYHQKLKDARTESNAIAEANKVKAQAEIDEAIAKADASIAKQAEKSAKKIAEMQADASKSVSEIANDVTGAIIDAISPASNDTGMVGKALTKLLKG